MHSSFDSERHVQGISDYLSNDGHLTSPRPQTGFLRPDYTRKENPGSAAPLPSKGGPFATKEKAATKKRNLVSSRDREERKLQLERENTELKEKENLLQREIVSMQTKLRRIESLINQRAKTNGNDNAVHDLQIDLQHECDELKTDNDATRERVRKLKVIEKGLAVRPAGAPSKVDKYAHVQGKLDVSHTPSMKRLTDEADEVRNQLVINKRKQLEMEQKIQELKRANVGIVGPADANRLRKEIQEMSQEQRDIEHEMFMLENDQKQREQMFKDTRTYVTDIQQKIRDANAINERIKQENFRLQIQTQQVTDFESELKMIEQERDNIERSIKSILSEPFMKKNNEKPIMQRIEDLQMQLRDAENNAKKIQLVRKDLEEQLVAKRAEHQKFTYERDMLSVDYNKAKEDFKERYGNQGPTEADVVQNLIQTDAGRYTNMLADLVMGDAPNWARLDFLDRDSGAKNVRDEIKYLTQEKADLAGELEKAQNLLRLQSDIQRENDEFFKREIERLQLVEKSASAKLEELARRADEKQRLINETQKKLNQSLERMPSPMKTHKAGVDPTDHLETKSEFSVATNETEMNMDENILDFKIEEASFFVDNFQQVPAISHLKAKDGAQFVTLLTVDFYNCPSETTGLAVGFEPNFNTQISFKNKVDKFYLTNLDRGCIKIDCYISRNNSAVHIGQSLILLKELLHHELLVTDSQTKAPMISKWARLQPVIDGNCEPNAQTRNIGQVHIKMRLRKPIQEAWRFNREQGEIENITKALSLNPTSGPLKPQKKVVTITVVGCSNLNLSYAGVRDVAPFFFYQFYTFDDRYSKNSAGINPKFNDTFSYEVVFDSKAHSYFEKESLEIILFDDNAPISGKELNGKGEPVDDMIGIARVPLKSLSQGNSVHDKFALLQPKSSIKVGEIEIKLSVMDLDYIASQSIRQTEVRTLHFSKEWEQDIIMKIANKLSGLQCEVDLLFGVFSGGQRTCTKEDFRQCCLTRLNLKQQITDREMDLFLDETELLKDKTYLERQDFLDLFQQAIMAARSDSHHYTYQNVSMAKYDSQTSIGIERSFTQSQSQGQSKEILDILGYVVRQGLHNDVMQALSQMSEVSSMQLKRILCDKGQMIDIDAAKIIAVLQQGQKVDNKKLENLFFEARHYMASRSDAVRKVREVVDKNVRNCIRYFEEQDYDKDGQIRVSGFIAALLRTEFRVSKEELEEAFHLLAQRYEFMLYQDWIESLNKDYVKFFSQSIQSYSREKLTDSTPNLVHHSDSKQDTYHAFKVNDETLQKACIKFENYMRGKDINLGVMFAILDSNSNNSLSFQEFRAKVYSLDMRLEEEEILALYKSLDKNGNQSITFDELIDKFCSLNNHQLLKRISSIITQSKTSPDFVFDKFCKDQQRGKMQMADFSVMVKDFIKRISNGEIHHIFKHFDRGSKGFINRNDFVAAFTTEVKDQTFQIHIEDILKPLQTKIKKFNVNVGELFEKADINKNFHISADEIATAIKDSSEGKIVLERAEIKLIEDFLLNRFNHKQITRAEFFEMMNTKFQNKNDEAEAKKSLVSLKQKCDTMKIDVQQHITLFNSEKTTKVNLRSFKLAVYELKCLTLYQIDNLAKFLDVDNEGFISIQSFIVAVENSTALGDSFKRQTMTSKRSDFDRTVSSRINKWDKK